jgi:dienelactone hydrolase
VSSSSAAWADEMSFLPQREFAARDTLNVGPEKSEDARDCLTRLSWNPLEFRVRCDAPRKHQGDALVRFASPIASGNEANDLVAMEWYVARDDLRRPAKAPAVVVVHELGSAMIAGRLFAAGLQQQGFHTFLMHLPYYGERWDGKQRLEASQIFAMMRQAIADVRRARDAVAALPFVDKGHIALQGTSLGGFISATGACFDSGYDSVFLMLAGGNIYDVLQNGQRDAANVRKFLERAGLTAEQLELLTRSIEPLRVAHRLNPSRTWLYSGTYDTVVPLNNALALVQAAGLDRSHHVRLAANHYTGIVYMPFVLKHIAEQIRSAPQRTLMPPE